MTIPRIITGVIPGSMCPKCGAPLTVIDKRDITPCTEHPQFVGCTMHMRTGCNYRSVITPDVIEKAGQKQAEIDAVPVEF